MKDSYQRFLARKNHFVNFIWLESGPLASYYVLKTRSVGELVAGMHRYFCTSWLTLGNIPSCSFHHSRGSISLSAFGVER